MPFVGAKKIQYLCAVCLSSMMRYESQMKRVLRPVCSRQCNGVLRGQDWAKHGHKGPMARKTFTRMMGPKNPAWKGGITLRHRKGNYVQVRYVRAPDWAKPMARKDGYIMEHRLVMAEWCGRLLTRTEVVHHANHIPMDNGRTNLELWPDNRSHKLAEHGRFVEGAVNLVFLEG